MGTLIDPPLRPIDPVRPAPVQRRGRSRARSKGRKQLGESYFDDLKAAQAVVLEHQRAFATGDASSGEELDRRIAEAGVERLEARGRYLTRRELLVLLRIVLVVVILAGAAVAVWMLALKGDPSAASHAALLA